MFLDLIALVLKDIKRRKFSSFLTFFAISLGIFSIFLITLISVGFQASVESQFEQFGSNRLYVADNFGSSTFTDGLTDSDISQIEGRSYVKKVYPYYGRSAQVEYANNFKSVQVFGTKLSEEFLEDNNIKISSGRVPKENEKFVTVIGPSLGDLKYDKQISVGSNLYIKETKFKVVGILEPIGSPQDDSSMYVNIDTLRELFEEGDSVGFADVIIDDGSDVSLAAINLQIFLDNKLGEDVVEVTSPEQILEQARSILTIIQSTLGGIALVSLLVGAFGIINTMYVIVTEKTKEIGIMKSIGATNENILLIYILQSGLYGFLGGILGIAMGSIATIAFEAVAQNAGYTFLVLNIEVSIVIYLLIFSIVVGLISGYLPARQASKLVIVETLRK